MAPTAKKVTTREEKSALKKAVRAAVVFLSLDLTPEERRVSLQPEAEEGLLEAVEAYLPEIKRTLDPAATPKQIDSILTVDTPPVFFPSAKEGWPTSHRWVDATTKLSVELERQDQGVVVMIGNIPVVTESSEPRIVRCVSCDRKNQVGDRPSIRSLCGACKAPLPVEIVCDGCDKKNRVDPSRIEDGPLCGACYEPLEVDESVTKSGRTGISGVIRAGVEPQLYYIQSARRRKGVARRMLRLFCRIVSAYGFNSFVAVSVGNEGRAFLLGLEAENEIQILGWEGGNALIRCQGALEDPRQRRLFGPQAKPNPLEDYVAAYDDPGSLELADDDAPPPEAFQRNDASVRPRQRQVWIVRTSPLFKSVAWNAVPNHGIFISLVGVYLLDDALRFLEGFNGSEMKKSQTRSWAVIAELDAGVKPGDVFYH